MKQFNTICGLPRAGTTLLCNILNQNPKIHATDTSIIGGIVGGITESASSQRELQTYIHNDPEFQKRFSKSIRGFVDTFYEGDKIIFDKGRGWNHLGLQFHEIFPDGHMFVVVRDIRDVFASMEKQHSKTPLYTPRDVIPTNTMLDRAAIMCSPEGMLGMAVSGIMDLARRKLPNVTFIPYENLCTDPEGIVKDIYDRAGIKEFRHDFKDIKDVSQDLDAAYCNKYPHGGSGDIGVKSIGVWKEILDGTTAEVIQSHFPEYNKLFKYGG